MQHSAQRCSRCDEPIPADAPGGICPGCALLAAANPTVLEEGALNGAPDLEDVAAAFPELEVLAIIGHGGMGVVFKARQPRLDRCIALKILPLRLAAQPGFSERFTREARTLARLNHPNIVAVYDFGESGGFFYLVMEFVDGVNLRQAICEGVTPEQALALVPRLCEALQFAHDKGVLHRDIKPENILLDTAGTVKLVDFGIAKFAGDPSGGAGLTASGSVLGTAAYMAPEQIEKPGTVDHRADIYSLGVVFYEMLTGELPIGRFAAPSQKSTVNTGIDEVVFRALEKERDRRQQSATEMKTQVEGAVAKSPSRRAPFGPNPWPHRLFWLIASIFVLPLVAIFAGLLLPRLAMIRNHLGEPSGGWPVMLVALVPLLAGAALFLGYRRTRPSAEAATPRVAWNPWPKRVFLLLVALLVLPMLLLGLGMAWSMIAYQQLKAPADTRSSAATIERVVTSAQPPFISEFPRGSVELVSVAEHPSNGSPGWRMDGSRANEGPFLNEGSKVFPDETQFGREFVFRTRDLPADASLPRFIVKNAAGWAGGGAPEAADDPGKPLPSHHLVAATFARSETSADIRVGIASVPWERLAQTFGDRPLHAFLSPERKPSWVALSTASESKDGRTVISSRHADEPDSEVRMVAVTKSGDELRASKSSANGETTEWTFRNLPLESVWEFRLQVRRMEWVEFRGIALAPSPSKSSPASASTTDARASDVLHAEAIRLARERFEMMQARLKTGVVSQLEEAAAVRDLAVAEARGDAAKIATARVQFAERQVELAQERAKLGLESQSQLKFLETELNAARQELARVQPPK